MRGQELWDWVAGGGTAPAVPAAAAPAAPAASAADAGGPDRAIAAPPSIVAPNDPARRLPEPARQKLLRLREAHDMASNWIMQLEERRRNALDEKRRAETYLGMVRASAATGRHGQGSTRSTFVTGGEPGGPYGMELRSPGGGAADGAQLASAEQRYADAVAELQGYQDQIDRALRQRSNIPQRAMAWLRDLPAGAQIAIHPGSGRPARGAKAAPTPADIETVRGKIAEKRAEREQVRSAPIKADEAKAIAARQVEALAAAAEPSVLGLIERGQPVVFREKQRMLTVITSGGGGAASDMSPDMLGLFCVIHGEAVIDWLNAKIDELAEDHIALSSEERKSRDAAILDEIDVLERQEEELISALELAGMPMQRRDDASIEAVLGIIVRRAA